MKLLRKRDIPEEKYTNAFLGYGPEDSHFVIELTYSKSYLYHLAPVSSKLCILYQDGWLSLLSVILFSDYGVDKYDIGAGFGHFGIAVDDVSLYDLYMNCCPSFFETVFYVSRFYTNFITSWFCF